MWRGRETHLPAQQDLCAGQMAGLSPTPAPPSRSAKNCDSLKLPRSEQSFRFLNKCIKSSLKQTIRYFANSLQRRAMHTLQLEGWRMSAYVPCGGGRRGVPAGHHVTFGSVLRGEWLAHFRNISVLCWKFFL